MPERGGMLGVRQFGGSPEKELSGSHTGFEAEYRTKGVGTSLPSRVESLQKEDLGVNGEPWKRCGQAGEVSISHSGWGDKGGDRHQLLSGSSSRASL